MTHAFVRLGAPLVALMLLLAACGDTGSPSAAATVNGDEVAIEELEGRYDSLAGNPQFAQQLESDEDGALEAQLQAELLTQMIQAKLLEQGADELGVEVDDEDLAQQRDRIEEQLQAQGMDLETAMEQQGLDEEDLEAELRTAALQEAVVDELAGGDEVDDEEVADFFEENREQYETARARHILVETEDEAEDVLDRLEDGEDFAEVAEEESTDEGSAAQGGELGDEPFPRGQMVPAFDEAVFEEAEVDEFYGPVETDFGFHVIQVLEREDPELDDVEDDIRAELEGGDGAAAFEEWFADLLEQAEIEVNPRFGEWDAEAGQVMPDVDEEELPAPNQPEGGGSGEEELDPEELEELEEELERQMEEQEDGEE